MCERRPPSDNRRQEQALNGRNRAEDVGTGANLLRDQVDGLSLERNEVLRDEQRERLGYPVLGRKSGERRSRYSVQDMTRFGANRGAEAAEDGRRCQPIESGAEDPFPRPGLLRGGCNSFGSSFHSIQPMEGMAMNLLNLNGFDSRRPPESGGLSRPPHPTGAAFGQEMVRWRRPADQDALPKFRRIAIAVESKPLVRNRR